MISIYPKRQNKTNFTDSKHQKTPLGQAYNNEYDKICLEGEKMKNNEFGALENSDRIQLSDLAKSVIIQCAHFGIGMLTASASKEAYFSPLGIAFCSGTNRENTLFSCLGAMLGYIISSEYLMAFRYVMALIIVYILKVYTNTFNSLREKLFVPALISFFATASTGIVVTITSSFDARKLFLFIAETVSSFGLAYFFAVSFLVIKKFKNRGYISARELTGTVISILILILSLKSVAFLGISLSGAICSYIIMSSSFLFRESGGAIIGTGVSLGFAMIGTVSPLSFCYCVAGLFSGVFSYSGRILCAFAYIFSFGAIFLYFDGTKADFAMLMETALASVLFILTPQKWFTDIKAQISISALSGEGSAVKNMLVSRLKLAKNAVGDMSGMVTKVAEILKEKAAPDTTGVYLRVRDNVCTDCASFEKCWRNGFSGTAGEFDVMIEEIRKTGSVTPSSSPASLQNRCIRIMSLCDSFNKNYSSYSARLGAEGRINEMRKITADQFENVCDMLDDMLCDVQSNIRLLTNKSDTIKSSIDNLGLDSSVNCYEDEYRNIFVNVSFSVENNVDEREIKNCIENITETQFEFPSSIKNDQEKILFFWEKTSFSAECIYHQSSGVEDEVCGDCFDSFYDGKGNFIAVLSDGMGTGSRAAIDGIMASSMFSRLIVSGFSFPCALRLVNSAMLVKSRDESLATLDILKLNLYTGQAVIYKAGATVSLLVRQGKVTEIKKSAMPIGILRQAEFGTVHGGLKNGDVFVMMSDGAADNNIQEIKSYIKDNGFSYDLPEKLCALAKTRAIDKCDDITVAVVKISINEE